MARRCRARTARVRSPPGTIRARVLSTTRRDRGGMTAAGSGCLPDQRSLLDSHCGLGAPSLSLPTQEMARRRMLVCASGIRSGIQCLRSFSVVWSNQVRAACGQRVFRPAARAKRDRLLDVRGRNLQVLDLAGAKHRWWWRRRHHTMHTPGSGGLRSSWPRNRPALGPCVTMRRDD